MKKDIHANDWREYTHKSKFEYVPDNSTWKGYALLFLVFGFIGLMCALVSISFELTEEELMTLFQLNFFLLIPINEEKIESSIDSAMEGPIGRMIQAGGCALILVFIVGMCITSFLVR